MAKSFLVAKKNQTGFWLPPFDINSKLEVERAWAFGAEHKLSPSLTFLARVPTLRLRFFSYFFPLILSHLGFWGLSLEKSLRCFSSWGAGKLNIMGPGPCSSSISTYIVSQLSFKINWNGKTNECLIEEISKSWIGLVQQRAKSHHDGEVKGSIPFPTSLNPRYELSVVRSWVFVHSS